MGVAAAILCTAVAPRGYAAIPAAAKNDPLYAKGYLVVTYYSGVSTNGTNPGTTTTGLNTAIGDARTNDLVAYFPAGTYSVNATIQAHTWAQNKPDNSFHSVLVGSTLGTSRPVIQLVSGATGFGNSNNPAPILDFRNFSVTSPTVEQGNTGFFQMLRGIDVDCNGNAGAIGIYFNQAQDSSIENVTVTATGAHTGIRGLASRAWGAVNVDVDGGQYGIDTTPDGSDSNSGSVVAGVTLNNQTVAAIQHSGFAPLTVAGFSISTPGSQAVITVPSGNHHVACVNLIDGAINLGAEPTVAAINNANGLNFYARNIYVTGGTKLVKSGSNSAVSGSGTWKLIGEYGYCDQAGVDSDNETSSNLLSGVISKSGAQGGGQTYSITSSAPTPPPDLALRHMWASLPSVDDPDCYDPVGAGAFTNGNVSATAFQNVVDTHRKIFVRKGVYLLNGTVTLHSDTILFGAARNLTRFEPQSSWNPGSETPFFATDADATGFTYLGDLSVGRQSGNVSVVNWQMGRNSMVHIARPYNYSSQTAAISNIKLQSSGGGRWFFPGQGSAAMTSSGSRVLNVTGTTEPIWIYGLDLEKHGCDTFSIFQNASNVRIYCGKSEYDDPTPGPHPVATFTNATNVAYFGHGALREAATGVGCFQFKGTTDAALASSIVPQNDGGSGTRYTVLENITGFSQVGVTYPNCVSLYKRGVLDDTAMTHANIAYGPVPAVWGWTNQDIGTVAKAGSSYFGSGSYTVNGSGSDIFGTNDAFQFAYRTVTGDCTITNRVATIEATDPSFSKAGLMIREKTIAGSKFVDVFLMPTGSRFQYRTNENEIAYNYAAGNGTETAPYWFKLQRVGNVFTAYKSPDGATWTTVGSVTNAMNSSVMIGLAVTSHNDGVLDTSTFDNVHVSTP